MKRPEILAPAGSLESFYAAVKAGCDAVYLGASNFNARANAANFSYEQLVEAVEYAHICGAKVYQTLNTVIFDKELPLMVEEMEKSIAAGVDAFIIQDLGVMSIAKGLSDDVEKHASTQMSVMNAKGALKAKELGFNRVVVARELTKEEIKAVCQTGVEVETFIHGALCMSVSGQCYMSVMLGGRSGNRGQCAQPCRLPFNFEGGENVLSLKDLSLIREMDELKEIGATSLKIEGRMKRPEYVAAAVTAARKARDGEAPDLELLEGIFSRSGFTDGYFNNTMDIEMFGIRRKEDVISAGDNIKRAAALFKDQHPVVGIEIKASLPTEQLPSITITDDEGNAVNVIGTDKTQKALNKPTTKERALESLSKLGGTPYYIKNAEIEIDEDCMMPVSLLNALRREATDKLTAIRIEKARKTKNQFTLNIEKHSKPTTGQKMHIRLQSKKQYSDSLLSIADLIILPYRELIALISSDEDLKANAGKFALELPRISFESQHNDIEEALLKLKKLGVTKAVCHNIGMVDLAKGFEPIGGFGMNITNSLSLKQLKELGFKGSDISIETPLSDAEDIQPCIEKGLVAYGYLPNMVFRNCPIKARIGCKGCGNSFKTLVDRKGIEFSIDCLANGNAELFNSVPLYLADRLKELRSFDFITLYFTKENAGEVIGIAQKYKRGEALEGEKTRGIYYRGLTEL